MAVTFGPVQVNPTLDYVAGNDIGPSASGWAGPFTIGTRKVILGIRGPDQSTFPVVTVPSALVAFLSLDGGTTWTPFVGQDVFTVVDARFGQGFPFAFAYKGKIYAQYVTTALEFKVAQFDPVSTLWTAFLDLGESASSTPASIMPHSLSSACCVDSNGIASFQILRFTALAVNLPTRVVRVNMDSVTVTGTWDAPDSTWEDLALMVDTSGYTYLSASGFANTHFASWFSADAAPGIFHDFSLGNVGQSAFGGTTGIWSFFSGAGKTPSVTQLTVLGGGDFTVEHQDAPLNTDLSLVPLFSAPYRSGDCYGIVYRGMHAPGGPFDRIYLNTKTTPTNTWSAAQLQYSSLTPFPTGGNYFSGYVVGTEFEFVSCVNVGGAPSQHADVSDFYYWRIALPAGCIPTPPPLTLACPGDIGQFGVFYTSTLVVTGGTAPYTFAITAGGLPPGLTLDPATGVISGTPFTPGIFSFTITVTDSLMATASVTCGIQITAQNICVLVPQPGPNNVEIALEPSEEGADAITITLEPQERQGT